MGSRAIKLFKSRGNLLNMRVDCSKAVEYSQNSSVWAQKQIK